MSGGGGLGVQRDTDLLLERRNWRLLKVGIAGHRLLREGKYREEEKEGRGRDELPEGGRDRGKRKECMQSRRIRES